MRRRLGPLSRAGTCAAICALATGTTLLGSGPALGEPAPAGHRAAAAAEVHSDLRVIEAEIDPVQPGGTTTLRAVISNDGPGETDAGFAVTVRLPEGATAVGPFFPDNCHPDTEADDLLCHFDTGLPVLRSASVEVPVRVEAGLHPGDQLEDGLVTVYDPDQPEITHSRPFAIDIV
ncbi:hypothetical protein [Kitasatospora cineracea]|uniref:Repeat protein (TIGR01451 family) n=1 Tax=Kitasatospora cineracea TaxID=88074 RepID=A0A8G1UM87_9ACTN|nr:hypothetical protein [Kitasatospora cineracea]ROR46395.1 hypothetical protein EDD39_4664 [Kitasatospora cineracea]